MKQSLNEYITEMRYPTALIIVQTTDLFIYSFIFTCGDFFLSLHAATSGWTLILRVLYFTHFWAEWF